MQPQTYMQSLYEIYILSVKQHVGFKYAIMGDV